MPSDLARLKIMAHRNRRIITALKIGYDIE